MGASNTEFINCFANYINTLDPSLQCSYASENCGSSFSYINYLRINYCWFDGYSLISLILSVRSNPFISTSNHYQFVLLVFQVKTMDFIADNYTSSAISKVSRIMGLSQAVAGATLLSFSNGVTDIITTIVLSYGSDNSNLGITIASFFGASIFCSTIVLLAVIINSKPGYINVIYPCYILLILIMTISNIIARKKIVLD